MTGVFGAEFASSLRGMAIGGDWEHRTSMLGTSSQQMTVVPLGDALQMVTALDIAHASFTTLSILSKLWPWDFKASTSA